MTPLLKVAINAASLVFTLAATAAVAYGTTKAADHLIARLEARELAAEDAMVYDARLRAVDEELAAEEQSKDA